MGLQQKIDGDLKEAMKAKAELRLSVLRLLSSAIRNRQIEKRTKLAKGSEATGAELEKASELTDEEVLETIRFESKKRKDAIDGFQKGGRVEMAEKEKQELAVLQGYLPQELSDDELNAIVSEVMKSMGAVTMKDFGKVMGQVMARAKNQVSGDRVSAAVKILLEKK